MRLLSRSSYILALSLVLISQQLIPQSQATQGQSSSQRPSGSTARKPAKVDQQTCADNGNYVNRNGQTVHRPENCSGPPKGATAQCRDGAYSFSQSRRGTCSHHGGVEKWL
jgi:hypothetical protein